MKTARTGMLEARAAGSKHCPEPKWHVARACVGYTKVKAEMRLSCGVLRG